MTTTLKRPLDGRSTLIPPARSYLQRVSALDRANDIRLKRAKLKLDIKARRVDIAELLMHPPEYVETMKVWDVVIALPKYGRVKVNKVLTWTEISVVKTVGGLSPRQRRALVRALGYSAQDGSGRGMVGLTRSEVAGAARGSNAGENEREA